MGVKEAAWMGRRKIPAARPVLAVMGLALPLLLASCAGAPSDQADPAALEDRLAAQETKTASLQQQLNAVTTAVAQQRAAAGTLRPPASPTPTPIPAVTGLPVSGTSKGSAGAQVTITEYSDYL